MAAVSVGPLPKLRGLPVTLPKDGAANIELQEGVPIFRASKAVQSRIEALLDKQQSSQLTTAEERELDRYEDLDDYFSFVNRVIRDLLVDPKPQD